MRKLAIFPNPSMPENPRTKDLIVTGLRNSFDKCHVGLVPAGSAGRKVYQGPLVPGPWAFEVTHPNVIDNAGIAKRERDAAERIALGEEFEIEGCPGVYRFVEPRYNDGAQLVRIRD